MIKNLLIFIILNAIFGKICMVVGYTIGTLGYSVVIFSTTLFFGSVYVYSLTGKAWWK